MDYLAKILNDISIDLSDEFDRNFQRKAFFDRAWPPRKMNGRGSLLIVSGRLRRSIRCRVSSHSVTWETSETYAAIHNYGGSLTVTAKMKRFFWYKYRATKDDAWKHMALMKVGSKIHIPQRQFIGDHPQVRKAVENVISDNMKNAIADFAKSFR